MVELNEVLADRLKSHGEYRDHARRTQMLKACIHEGQNWSRLSDIQKESLEMFAHKIGRILEGNPDHEDHWDDIAGYAKLVADRLREDKSKPEVHVTNIGKLEGGVPTNVGKVQPFTMAPFKAPEPNRPGTPEDGGHHANAEGTFSSSLFRPPNK